MSIVVPLYSSNLPASHEYLTRFTPKRDVPSKDDSDLLKQIRKALRGADTEASSEIHSTTFCYTEDPDEEEELAWNSHAVVLSRGGIIQRKWSFQEEKQSVQWACLGWLEQYTSTNPTSSHGAHQLPTDLTSKPSEENRTFGPFSHVRQTKKTDAGSLTREPGVFVFLRSIGRIYLKNGLDFTFALPFVVRRAWALYPHGVMIQRVLEPSERLEAELSGDDILPTIFTITNPFAEPAAIGQTSGIIGGFDKEPAVLKDEIENSRRPLRSIPPTEMVVWTSTRGLGCKDDITITVDVETRSLSIWRHAYQKPKDTPVPLSQSMTNARLKKRQSMIGGHSRRSSAAAFLGPTFSPKTRTPDTSPGAAFSDLPPLASLPGMPASLAATQSLGSLGTGGSSQQSAHSRIRRSSLTRNDLSMTMDRMALGGRLEGDAALVPMEHGRMKASFWMERLYTTQIDQEDAQSWRLIEAAIFDQRWDGTSTRSLLGICLPTSQLLQIYSLSPDDDRILRVGLVTQLTATSITPLRITRPDIWDLIVVKPDRSLTILTHGVKEVPLEVQPRKSNEESQMPVDPASAISMTTKHQIVSVKTTLSFSLVVTLQDGFRGRTTLDLVPKDYLTRQCLHAISLAMRPDDFFRLHLDFLRNWNSAGLSPIPETQFELLSETIYAFFGLHLPKPAEPTDAWASLGQSPSSQRFYEDPVMKKLQPPPPPSITNRVSSSSSSDSLASTLYALHLLAEDLRLVVHTYQSLLRLAPVICQIALAIRPEWADYWKRLCPDALDIWPHYGILPSESVNDRLPIWPPGISSLLYGRLSNPDWRTSWTDIEETTTTFGITPSFAFGRTTPQQNGSLLKDLYETLSEASVKETYKRCENAMYLMVNSQVKEECIDRLPLGLAAPLREASRTCQLAPPGDWPLSAYSTIGRNDLSASADMAPDVLYNDGYKQAKDFINPQHRQSINEIVQEANTAVGGQLDAVSGVELDLADFTDIRFGQDRRLEEVARMLNSSKIPSVKAVERPELNEHDQGKEYQNQSIRIAERTLALPFGRAMFTFGSIPTVTREAYSIPKIEYSVRIQPLNMTVVPEPGKIPPDSLNWGDFHNGVAAGLRISPFSGRIESSWIAFNKPTELTPEHAGFLFGLGLTGHLREMLTWHTFSYLTPKHDLTSIAILLGLSAANIGNGNQHVTKLLAVHTPALLPTPSVDLNVSLLTQGAGLAGVGLLHMGTKNRRMAEVCLNQISRRDLVQPDLSNEHREAYTYSAAIALGMIMLGKGSSIPADMSIVSRLSVLIHGDVNTNKGLSRLPPFDINLTSPAATIALGFMYLKTERKDIAEVLAIPDTVLALNRIQPSFILVRVIARALIMWDEISPTAEWLVSQLPAAFRAAVDARNMGEPLDDAIEIAYYNILAGSCFAVGLKYAGTARQAAYMMIIRHFDTFTKLVYSNGPAFELKIKRSAYRDGLNLISIALSMVMAGTGEISCFRRLRIAYGMYQHTMFNQQFKYGIHMATHMSIGLLFLGGGRFTLGTSNAAIACMTTAFFPRFHHTSADNKSYLQALRHLWVLAVEPRCLIARDVDTSEVVYLPVKITTQDGPEVATTQLISPTLIPDLDKLLSIRIDTPRYWPFYLDIERIPRHREALLNNQTLFVKRRTAFLSYTEDPRGSRSLFVRSGASAGDAATLDFPQMTDTQVHPAGDLSEFITSFSNDVLFLAFAAHLFDDGDSEARQIFSNYCHAALLDSILQDKPQTLQTHLTLFRYRNMTPASRYFQLHLQDLRFATEFYSKIYERRFSGRSENNQRPGLIRESTVAAALHALDEKLDAIRSAPDFQAVLGLYARGEPLPKLDQTSAGYLAFYLLRNAVPSSTLLVILRRLARDAHTQCLGRPEPEGTTDGIGLDLGIKEVLHATGIKMTPSLGSGWSLRSLDEVIEAWKV